MCVSLCKACKPDRFALSVSSTLHTETKADQYHPVAVKESRGAWSRADGSALCVDGAKEWAASSNETMADCLRSSTPFVTL